MKGASALLLALLMLCANASAQALDDPYQTLASGSSLTGVIESQLPSVAFVDMPGDVFDRAIEALGDIASAYALVGRASVDGRYGYILGVQTAAESPLLGRSVYDDGALARVATGVSLNYDPESPTILHITPDDYGASDLIAVFNLLISGDIAYLVDIAARGVSVCAPPPPYLRVDQYVGGAYRREYVALTAADVASAKASATVYQPDEIGDYAICLVDVGDDPDEAYMRNAPLPAPLLALARERCGFAIGSPDDIARVVAASMTVTAYGRSRTQEITDRGTLDRLTAILRNAAPAQLGNCPYAGVLTLTMEDGSAVIVQKATDSCGNMLFGSMRCYKTSRADNEAFWAIFGEAYAVLSE